MSKKIILNAWPMALMCCLVLFLGNPSISAFDYVCGDANNDGAINIGDAVYILNTVFHNGPLPALDCCLDCSPGETRPCYTGPPGTEGVGECQSGTQACVDGVWGPCEGEILPGVEVCDGLDTDCDGNSDDGMTRPCYTGPPGTEGIGECVSGTQVCSGGEWSSCIGEVLPGNEDCDGLDNDCDGVEDNWCYIPNAAAQCQDGSCQFVECISGWANCDGNLSNGCELDLISTNTNWSNTDPLGYYCGDVGNGCGSDSFNVDWRGRYWFSIGTDECCVFEVADVGIRLTLQVPAGINYDLYLWNYSTQSIIASSTNSDPGVDEYIEDCNPDDFFSDDGTDYKIEVRYVSGSSCSNWILIYQNCP